MLNVWHIFCRTRETDWYLVWTRRSIFYHINRMITITDGFYLVIIRKQNLWSMHGHNRRLITLTVITLSGFPCTFWKMTQNSLTENCSNKKLFKQKTQLFKLPLHLYFHIHFGNVTPFLHISDNWCFLQIPTKHLQKLRKRILANFGNPENKHS